MSDPLNNIDYAKLETKTLLQEIVRGRERIARMELSIRDTKIALGNPKAPHHLEPELAKARKNLQEIEKLLALVPSDQIPRGFSVQSHAVPIRNPKTGFEYFEVGGDDWNPTVFGVDPGKGDDRSAIYGPSPLSKFDLRIDPVTGEFELEPGVFSNAVAPPDYGADLKTLLGDPPDAKAIKKLLVEALSKIDKNLGTNSVVKSLIIDPVSFVMAADIETSRDAMAATYGALKATAQASGIPIMYSVDVDEGEEENVAQTKKAFTEADLPICGFQPLTINPNTGYMGPALYCLVEIDGGVVVTGVRKEKCAFNHNLVDGSRVVGGITLNGGGQLFGDRIAQKNGIEVKYPLRWMSLDDVSQYMPPSKRRNVSNPPPWKVEKLAPVSSTSKSGKKALDLDKVEQITDWVKRGLVSRETIAREFELEPIPSEVPTDVHPSRSRFEAIFGKGKSERPARWIAKPDEYARLRASYDKLQQETVQLKALVTRAEKDRDNLKKKLKEAESTIASVKHEAEVALRKIREDNLRKQHVHRWQVEAVRNSGVTVEGADATIFELEDPDSSLRYLVVATVPRDTPSRVQEQWMDDLQNKLDARFGEGIVQYFIAPEDMTISVLEVQPGVEDQEDEDDLFQF